MTTATPDEAIHLNAAGRGVHIVTLVALGLVAVCAFAIAYPGLLWVGLELASLPFAVAVLLPVAIDAGMLTAGLLAAVRRSQRRTAHLERSLLLGLVVVSVIAQVTHVVAAQQQQQWSPHTAVGALVAAAIPVTLLLTTEAALRSLFSEVPARRGTSRASTARAVTAAAAAPTATRVVSARRPSPAKVPSAAPVEDGAKLDPESDGYRDALRRLAAGEISAREAGRLTGWHRDRMAREASALREGVLA